MFTYLTTGGHIINDRRLWFSSVYGWEMTCGLKVSVPVHRKTWWGDQTAERFESSPSRMVGQLVAQNMGESSLVVKWKRNHWLTPPLSKLPSTPNPSACDCRDKWHPFDTIECNIISPPGATATSVPHGKIPLISSSAQYQADEDRNQSLNHLGSCKVAVVMLSNAYRYVE